MGGEYDERFSRWYRSSGTRSVVAMVALATVVALDAAYGLVVIWGNSILDAAERGSLTIASATVFDTVVMGLGLASIAAYIAAAIAFLAWLSRAVDNVPSLTGRLPRYSPREAIGWWFVPFANWVMPYRIVRNLADTLDAVRPMGPLIAAWWLFWIAENVAGVLLFRRPEPFTIEEIRQELNLGFVPSALSIIAGILAILVVRRLAAEEQRNLALRWMPSEEQMAAAGRPPSAA